VRSNPSAVVANSCTHRRRDATKQFRRVGVVGVYWALCVEAVIPKKKVSVMTTVVLKDFFPVDFLAFSKIDFFAVQYHIFMSWLLYCLSTVLLHYQSG